MSSLFVLQCCILIPSFLWCPFRSSRTLDSLFYFVHFSKSSLAFCLMVWFNRFLKSGGEVGFHFRCNLHISFSSVRCRICDRDWFRGSSTFWVAPCFCDVFLFTFAFFGLWSDCSESMPSSSASFKSRILGKFGSHWVIIWGRVFINCSETSAVLYVWRAIIALRSSY